MHMQRSGNETIENDLLITTSDVCVHGDRRKESKEWLAWRIIQFMCLP